MLRYLFLTGWLLALASAAAQPENLPPKREFRGVWVATHKRIDFPSAAGLSPEILKAEFINYLDVFEKNGLNTVFVQIRGEADAWYDSRFAPWSLYLTGELGRPTQPYFDLLRFMIEATHARNMEFHAWLNPFRAWTNAQRPVHPQHILVSRPQWCLPFDNAWYLDPGMPEVRNHLLDVVLEVVEKYDVDGIHFDDYFYPYPKPGLSFPDTASFRRHGRGFASLDDWRRNNIDRFIRDANLSIKAAKPWVKFGVSPFGVWRNQADDARGSATRAGVRTYDDLYADVRAWHQNGWVDYLIPQLYWSIGFPAASFEVLLEWWKDNTFARSMYAGHALYKVANNTDANWNKPDEINRQVYLTRKSGLIGGSAFFSAKWFLTNPLGIADSLRNGPYRYPALPPAMAWIDPDPPASPAGLAASATKRGMVLAWSPVQGAYRYAIYRTPARQNPDADDARQLIGIAPGGAAYFTDTQTRHLQRYTYSVSALDRLSNESALALAVKKRQWLAPRNP